MLPFEDQELIDYIFSLKSQERRLRSSISTLGAYSLESKCGFFEVFMYGDLPMLMFKADTYTHRSIFDSYS